ncbi:MAG: hypothetical protein VCC36_10405 [Gammaproteobacteria bacterium]
MAGQVWLVHPLGSIDVAFARALIVLAGALDDMGNHLVFADSYTVAVE